MINKRIIAILSVIISISILFVMTILSIITMVKQSSKKELPVTITKENKQQTHIKEINNITFIPIIEKEESIVRNDTVAEKSEEVTEEEYFWYNNVNLPFSTEFKQYIDHICEEYKVSPSLLFALIETESNFEPNIISATNDYGLCQINEINFSSLSKDFNINYKQFYKEILKPEINILAGVKMLSDAIHNYGNDSISLGLMVYNCGYWGALNLWEQNIYTTTYVDIVMEKYYNYYAIIGK